MVLGAVQTGGVVEWPTAVRGEVGCSQLGAGGVPPHTSGQLETPPLPH